MAMTFTDARDLVTLALAILGSVSGVWAYIQKRSFKQQAQLVDKLADMVHETREVKEALVAHILEDTSVQSTIATTLRIWVDRLEKEESKR
jgi:hypothetical protein